MTTADTITGVAQQVSALRDRLDLVWAQHEREHKQHDESHGRERQSTADALKVAAELAKENKRDSNEWRAAMDDRESRFSTKSDVVAILDRLDKIERAGLVAAERDRLRMADEAEDKRQTERRQTRAQWTVGLVVGLLATFGAILVNLVIRLTAGG